MNIKTLIGASFFISIVAANPLTLQPPTPPEKGEGSSSSPFFNAIVPPCTTVDNPNHENLLMSGILLNYGRPRVSIWNKYFHVQPDINFNDAEIQAINNALYILKQVLPCVAFGIYKKTDRPTGDYVFIVKGTSNGCNSQIGRMGGRQIMNLQSPGCLNQGEILHEMMHALGFPHEHNRHDRDDYLNIYFQNVIPGMEYNFAKVPPAEYNFGVAYNYWSIMHYKSDSFSVNRQPTMLAKTSAPIGHTGVLQNTDIQKLKLMYNC